MNKEGVLTLERLKSNLSLALRVCLRTQYIKGIDESQFLSILFDSDIRSLDQEIQIKFIGSVDLLAPENCWVCDRCQEAIEDETDLVIEALYNDEDQLVDILLVHADSGSKARNCEYHPVGNRFNDRGQLQSWSSRILAYDLLNGYDWAVLRWKKLQEKSSYQLQQEILYRVFTPHYIKFKSHYEDYHEEKNKFHKHFPSKASSIKCDNCKQQITDLNDIAIQYATDSISCCTELAIIHVPNLSSECCHSHVVGGRIVLFKDLLSGDLESKKVINEWRAKITRSTYLSLMGYLSLMSEIVNSNNY